MWTRSWPRMLGPAVGQRSHRVAECSLTGHRWFPAASFLARDFRPPGPPARAFQAQGLPTLVFPALNWLALGLPTLGFPLLGFPLLGFPTLNWLALGATVRAATVRVATGRVQVPSQALARGAAHLAVRVVASGRG